MKNPGHARWNGHWRWNGLIGACLALSLAAGCGDPPPPPPPPAPQEPAPPARPTFTQTQFEEILHGMTYPQARDVLGAESDRQESTYSAGDSAYVAPTVTAWHIWENPDGSFIKLGFVQKKVVEKVAEDLPE